jgi:hypothetical protein
MFLLIGFYEDANEQRMAEFSECVRRNALNPHIDQLTVFLEGDLTVEKATAKVPALANAKVALVEHGPRVTFDFLFDHANRELSENAVVLANTDISFDESLGLLIDHPLDGQMLCLSRWDEGADGSARLFDQANSQDAWVFEPPLPRITAPFGLGLPGCDNRVAYEAERAGLSLSNPSRTVRALHLHLSGVRRYTPEQRIPGPYRFVPPSFLPARASEDSTKRPPAAEFPSHRGRRAEQLVESRFRDTQQMLARSLGGPLGRGLRRELRRAIAARIDAPPRPLHGPLADVAFREPMGYSLARLDFGASTHNNDSRPLVAIPPLLKGLMYTQVVANNARPVEVQFRSPGRLFVLAGRGWEGYAPAAAYLDDAGWRETVEPLRTRDGTIFDVWSLEAGTNERLVIPTQVMLASTTLERLT